LIFLTYPFHENNILNQLATQPFSLSDYLPLIQLAINPLLLKPQKVNFW